MRRGRVILQPDAREGLAGPLWVEERPVVPAKPGNAGGGKGPLFKESASRRDRHPEENWREPTASSYGWEVTDGVAHQKRRTRLTTGSTRLYDKFFVSSRHPWSGPSFAAAIIAVHRGSTARSFADIETYGRDQWLDELIWRRTQEGNVSSPAGPTRVHSERRWQGFQAKPSGIPASKIASCRWLRCWSWSRSFEADLEPEQHAYRPERSALDCRSPSGTAAQDGSHRGGGRGPLGLLRQHSSRRVDKVGVPPDQRRPHAAALEDVAGNTGGRDRCEREPPSDDPEQGPGDGNHRKGRPISPLLSNIYIRRFAGWKTGRHEKRLTAKDRQLCR